MENFIYKKDYSTDSVREEYEPWEAQILGWEADCRRCETGCASGKADPAAGARFLSLLMVMDSIAMEGGGNISASINSQTGQAEITASFRRLVLGDYLDTHYYLLNVITLADAASFSAENGIIRLTAISYFMDGADHDSRKERSKKDAHIRRQIAELLESLSEVRE